MAKLKVAVIGLGRIASTIDDEIEKYDGNHLPYSHIACYPGGAGSRNRWHGGHVGRTA